MSELENRLRCLVRTSPLWKAGTCVMAACSGGADSLALTDVMGKAAREDGITVRVVHVQHHLRGEAAEEDARFVASFCQARGLPFRRCDVYPDRLVREAGLSPEEAARRLRYEALEACRREYGAEGIFLAHHQDDQAETVLLNLLRGAGTRGLRGMLPVNGYLARPFLDATRQDMIQYCLEQAIAFRTDASNFDESLRRNWIRQTLLPMLEARNPRIRRQLSQTARLAAEDEACLEFQARQYFQRYGREAGGCWEVKTGPEFAALPRALKSRVVRLIVEKAGGGEAGYGHILDILALVARGVGNKALDVPGQVRIIYCNGRLMAGKNQRSREEERAAKLAQKEQQRNASQH